MKFGRLLIAAVLLGGLSAAVWYSNKKTAADAGKPPADASPKVLTLKKEDITQLEFKHREGDPTIVKKSGDGWRITAPKDLPASQSAIDSILSSVSDISSDRLLDSNATDLAGYGLSPAVVEVDITMKDGKVSKLLLGEDTPTGSDVYAKVESDPRLFTVGSFNKTSLDKTFNDLRDKSVLFFNPDKVSRVELTAKKETIEFGRVNANEWQILKPKAARADGLQVDEMVRKVKDAMTETLSDDDEKKAVSAFGSAPALATIKITDASGTQTLEIRKAKDDYYAKSSSVPGVLKVNADLGMALDKSLDDFRNKKLFDFGFSDPTKIEFKDGAKDVTFEKTGDKWTSGGKTMDSISVQSLIDKLRDLSATKFPDTGFTSAAIEFTVVSNDGKRIEKVQIGANNIAKREGEPALYEIDAKAVQDARQAAGDIREAAASTDKKK